MYFKSFDNSDGFFPISENYHQQGILNKTIAPIIIDNNVEIDLRSKTNLSLRDFTKIENHDS